MEGLWLPTDVPEGGEAVDLDSSAESSGFSSGVGEEASSVKERLASEGGVGSVIVAGRRDEGEDDAAREYRYRSLLAAG